jgi:hypothetical protein
MARRRMAVPQVQAPHIGVALDLTRPRAERREPELHLGGADDLFDGQAIVTGGWVVLDGAKRAL